VAGQKKVSPMVIAIVILVVVVVVALIVYSTASKKRPLTMQQANPEKVWQMQQQQGKGGMMPALGSKLSQQGQQAPR